MIEAMKLKQFLELVSDADILYEGEFAVSNNTKYVDTELYQRDNGTQFWVVRVLKVKPFSKTKTISPDITEFIFQEGAPALKDIDVTVYKVDSKEVAESIYIDQLTPM